MGHLGIERTTSLLRDRFYWPTMIEDIEQHVKSCPHCLRFKTQPKKVELHPSIATRLLELVHIDYLTVEAPDNSKSSKDINILVITDHFTRYAQTHVTSSQKAHVVTKTLWEHFFMHYGFPEKILSEQGRNFESALISELCELTQIRKLRTMPYRPEGNGSCERFNRTLISMLGTLPEDFKSQWPQHISTLTYAYNCTRSNATGFRGLGAVLSQKQADGWYHPITYASRVMNETEQRYHSNKQEFLTLKWVVTEQFHEYLSPYGKNRNEFVVCTKNNPLTYIFSSANLDAAGQ